MRDNDVFDDRAPPSSNFDFLIFARGAIRYSSLRKTKSRRSWTPRPAFRFVDSENQFSFRGSRTRKRQILW